MQKLSSIDVLGSCCLACHREVVIHITSYVVLAIAGMHEEDLWRGHQCIQT